MSNEFVKCLICNKEFKKSPSFVYHLKVKHNISKEDYITKFNCKQDFEYNIVYPEEAKKQISETKKKLIAEGKIDFSYLKETNKKRSQKFVEKFKSLTKQQQKDFLTPFTKAGSAATKEMWATASEEKKKIIIDKICKNKDRRITIEFNCPTCGKFLKRTYCLDELQKMHFCNYLCAKKYKSDNNITDSITKNSYYFKKFDKFFYLRSSFEMLLIQILDNLNFDTVEYESVYINYNLCNNIKTCFVDFFVQKDNKKYIIEVGCKNFKLLDKEETRAKNIAIRNYCNQNNIKFLFLTEVNFPFKQKLNFPIERKIEEFKKKLC